MRQAVCERSAYDTLFIPYHQVNVSYFITVPDQRFTNTEHFLSCYDFSVDE
jgi:hypothetical protein